MSYYDQCDCARCLSGAWIPGRGARWRLALVVAITGLVLLVAAQNPADAQPAGRCAEVRAYVAPNLPARFVALAWRESNCRNDVGNGCCVGWWAIHEITFRDAQGQAIAQRCGHATWHNIRGDTVAAKLRQVCMARGLYQLRGYQPWSL